MSEDWQARAEKAEAELAKARKYPNDVQRPTFGPWEWREYADRLEKLWVAQNLKLGKAEAKCKAIDDALDKLRGLFYPTSPADAGGEG